MSMIKCPECGRDVSDQATSCPGCGYKISHKHRKISIPKRIYFGVLLGVVILLSMFFISKNQKNRYEIADGIYLGMTKDNAMKILGSQFDVYIPNDKSELEIMINYATGKNNAALNYFNINESGVWCVGLVFNDKALLESVDFTGCEKCQTFDNWCSVLGQSNVRPRTHGSWKKGRVDLTDDIVMLIGHCYTDPDRTGYSATITTKEIAEQKKRSYY